MEQPYRRVSTLISFELVQLLGLVAMTDVVRETPALIVANCAELRRGEHHELQGPPTRACSRPHTLWGGRR